MIVAAARRFFLFVGCLAAGTAVIGAFIAVISSNDVARVVSLAYYAVGTLCITFGFALGTRGSFRMPRRGEAQARIAVEAQETIASSGLLIAVGVLLLVIGIVVDPRVRLV